jgi:hypothetical protein
MVVKDVQAISYSKIWWLGTDPKLAYPDHLMGYRHQGLLFHPVVPYCLDYSAWYAWFHGYSLKFQIGHKDMLANNKNKYIFLNARKFFMEGFIFVCVHYRCPLSSFTMDITRDDNFTLETPENENMKMCLSGPRIYKTTYIQDNE